jgi:antitoxin VapB
MAKARVFRSGSGQAVQLPKGFHLTAQDVEIFRRGDEIVLLEKPRDMADAFRLLASLPKDFMTGGRQDDSPQMREGL